MIFSGSVSQSGSRDVYDDRILNFHVTDCAHEDAFDPVIGKWERTTLVVFGHEILTEQARSQTCGHKQL
jgi:hypothetical protein